MARKPNHETTGDAQKSQPRYERLGGGKRPPKATGEKSEFLIRPESLLEGLADGFFLLDKEWRYTYVNRAGAAFLDTSADKLAGKALWDTVPQGRQSRLGQECVLAVERQKTTVWEERCERLDRWFSYRCCPVDGGLAVLVTDITDHKRVEEALRQSERSACRRLAETEAIYRSAHIGLCVLDRDLRFVRLNERLAEINGLSIQENLGKTFREVAPDLAEAGEKLAERIFRTGEPAFHAEFCGTLPTRPGAVRHWITNWLPLKNERGEVTAVNVVIDEVTQEKQMHKALQDSEQRLRLVLDGGQMGRWEWDLRTDSMFWCRRVHDLLGMSDSTPARGESLLARVHPRDRDALRAQVKKAVAEQGDFQAEFRVIKGKGETRGEVFWLNLRGKVVCDEEGQASRMLGVLYDVTERKQMEARLLELNERLEGEVQAQTEEMKATIDRLQDEVARRVLAEGRLRKRSQMLEAFFEHTITPLAFLDRSFNFIRVNDAYAKADGKTPEYFVGRNHFMLYPDAEMREVFEQVVRTCQPYRAQARPFTYSDGPQRMRYWNWQLTPVLSDSGGVRFLVFSLEDVTSQRGAVQELHQRASQLQKLTLELSQAEDRERRRLAEILHDDLQQVLAAAKFHVGMLNARIRGDDELLELTGQISDLLKEAIGKSRSLSHELSPAVLYQSDLGETFEWLARQLQAKHGLNVVVEVRGRIEPRSEALRAFLYKAAQELLFNVVKHAGVPEARLRVQRIAGHVWLTISDRGRGFDCGTLDKRGFGLMSIRERVELLGGRMRIKSSVGRGSTFLIRVPDHEASPPPAEPDVAVVPLDPAGAAVRDQRGSADRSLHVLLVDDHKVVREGLASLLGSQRDIHVVGHAANGREAIEMAVALRPDVVVMDVAMPVMGGEEATRHIKKRLPQTRIVALSMFQEGPVVKRMHRAGADVYLLKTSPAEELLCAIRGRPIKPEGDGPASPEPPTKEFV